MIGNLVIYIGLGLFSMLLIFLISLGKMSERKEIWRRLGIPHDKPGLIFGNLKGISLARPLANAIRKTYNKYKVQRIPFCGFVMLTKPVAIVTDLDLAHDILVRDADKFCDRGSYHNTAEDTFSENLWNLEGEEWLKVHKKLSPLFTVEKMQKILPDIIDEAEKLADAVEDSEEDVVDIYDLCQRYILDVISDRLFDLERRTLQKPYNEYRRYVDEYLLTPRSKVAVALMECQRIVARAHHLTLALEPAINFFYAYIGGAIMHYENIRHNKSDNFIKQLIDIKNEKEEEKRLSYDEIVANAGLFVAAGYDTCASAMTFALYELGIQRNIQKKLRREINEVMEKHNDELTLEAINEMKYLDMVISETLRKYPIYPYLERVANCAYPTKDNDYTIYKGMKVIIPIEAILRDPDIYPDPAKFQPERFDAEERNQRHPMAWIPFGEGPRTCIGKRLGQLMIRIGLIVLLTNYEFYGCSLTPIPMQIDMNSRLLRPKKQVYLRVASI